MRLTKNRLGLVFMIIVLAGAGLTYWVLENTDDTTLYTMPDDSMSPTIHQGEVVEATPLDNASLDRGDIVVLRDTKNPEALLIRRIVGIPGDTMSNENGQLKAISTGVEYIPYEDYQTVGEIPYTNVPVDTVYVVGDNRSADTYDSRNELGLVPIGNIIEKVQS